MPLTRRENREPASGFSLTELLVVIGVIAIMAAFAVPSLTAYMRAYRFRAAAAEVVGELQAARNRAIARNASRGVSLYVADRDSYRFVDEDLMLDPGRPPGSEFGVLRTLPQGVFFVAAADPGVRFGRMGQACLINDTCDRPQPGPVCQAGEACFDAPGNYVGPAPLGAGSQITLQRAVDGLQQVIVIPPGGRAEVR